MANRNFKVPGSPEPWPAGEVAGYHITHLENLPSMIECGAIKSDRSRKAASIANRNIAHKHIKARRDATVVRVAQGGTLSDYAPFYLAPRSPMLHAIHTGFRRRQAEFLVRDEVPFTAVRLVGVCDEDARAEVAKMLAGTEFEPEIRIREDWYY